MFDFKYSDEERLSRRQAAEELLDIAYAFTAGGPVEVTPPAAGSPLWGPTSVVWGAP